jgi:hypothetical protein
MDGQHLGIDVTIQDLLSKILAASSFMLRVTDCPDLRSHTLLGSSSIAAGSTPSDAAYSYASASTGTHGWHVLGYLCRAVAYFSHRNNVRLEPYRPCCWQH